MDNAPQILVVDDELGPREAVRMILKSKYQVMTAANGPDALQHIGRMPPDIVFLDIKMRQMNGIDVLKAIKQVNSGIEVIMMTAYASLGTAQEAMAYGASEYLIKPFSKKEVEGAVEKALARRAERTETNRQVRTLLEQMRTLAHASSAAVGPEEVLQSVAVVLEQVNLLLRATTAVLHVLEDSGRALVCKLCLGNPVRQRSEFEGEGWTSALRRTLQARRPFILSSNAPDPSHAEMARPLKALGYRGGAFFPMLMGDEEWGVLSFLYDAPREFPGEWIDIGRTIAELLALSLRTHQRYHASKQEAAQQAQRAVQLTILREVSRVIVGNLDLTKTLKAIGDQLQVGLGYAGFYVWLSEGNGTQWREAYGSGPCYGWQPSDDASSLPGELQVDRSTQAHSLVAPIVRQGTIVGVLKLVRETHQGPIAEFEIELLRMLLDYIGLAVNNSLLYGEIKETKSYLDNLISGAGDAIITIDRDDQITSWNPSAERIFQYQEQEILEQNIGKLFPLEPYEQWREEVLQQCGIKHLETQLKQRNGEPFHASLTLSPLRGVRDEIVGFSAIIRDVTEDRQLRERLLQSEKLSALGELAAGIAHNFNNILAAILGRTYLLVQAPTDFDAVRKHVAIIEKTVADGAAMVQRIQKFARGNPESAFSPTDLNQLVRETVDATQIIWKDQALHQGNPIEVVMDLGRLPPVRTRSAELREVLTNLILNAVDAMPQGGRLTLRTVRRERVACIEVSDTGMGMAEEVKRRAFNPFFTTKGERGTGLGLSISHALIKAHHGEIALQSEVGRGTTVVITLPIE